MHDLVLDASDIQKSYGRGDSRFDALKGVSLQVARGESIAIIGKSGSGKSTLMHILAMLDAPDAGTLRIAGVDATSLSQADIHRIRNAEFGFVFQQFFLVPDATVLENVVMPLKIAGVGRRERTERGMAALRALELDDKAKNRATALSGGQKQRAVIARALVNEPSVIFADEPTGNLDTVTGRNVEDTLFALNRDQGITLVIVTHDEELAARCDRQIHLRDGLVVVPEGATQGATQAAAVTA